MPTQARKKKSVRVPAWRLMVLLVLSLFITATFLRLNNAGMGERRDAIVSADKVGDDERTQDRVYDLQRYVNSHMNTNTGDIFLSGKYERDVQKIITEAEEANRSNNNAVTNAIAACRPRYVGYSREYVQCVIDEQKKYGSADDPIDSVSMPDENLYKHSFIAPIWTPDFAGVMVLIDIVLATVIVARIIIWIILKIMLRRQYKRA